MSDIAPLEIQALAKIMDELDYYQMLHLERSASERDIRKAFHQTSRTFHPDTNRHLAKDLRDHSARISKLVTEAYCVLRDRRRRRAYDAKLNTGEGVRMQLAEARAADVKQQAQERQGKTPKGRQFYQKAMEDVASGDDKSAARNIQMALTFEPGNDFFKEQLKEIKARG